METLLDCACAQVRQARRQCGWCIRPSLGIAPTPLWPPTRTRIARAPPRAASYISRTCCPHANAGPTAHPPRHSCIAAGVARPGTAWPGPAGADSFKSRRMVIHSVASAIVGQTARAVLFGYISISPLERPRLSATAAHTAGARLPPKNIPGDRHRAVHGARGGASGTLLPRARAGLWVRIWRRIWPVNGAGQSRLPPRPRLPESPQIELQRACARVHSTEHGSLASSEEHTLLPA